MADNTKSGNRSGGNYRNQQQVDYTPEIEEVFGKDYRQLLLNMAERADNTLINNIKKFVEINSRHITTSQIRNVYSEIKMARLAELPLKRPKLAYIAGRTDRNLKGMHILLYLLDVLIQEIKTDEQHKSFNMFFESVLAYHRFFDKSNK